eukprot:GDKI01024398.1.p1 GENE.GDKI01024398.1~~GDKI01024398.1.p1  ORF type:complete len:369 (-),score=17.66 GDKI01024398.1:27-1133(-)
MRKETKKPVSETRLFAFTLLAHGGAASLSRILVAPLDRVKVIMQTREHFHEKNVLPKHGGVRTALTEVYRLQGPRSFWWGFGPHCSAALLTTGVRLVAFQKLGLYFLPGGDAATSGIEHVARIFGCYFTSSAVALTLFYPLDVMYTRLATDEGKVGAHKQRNFNGFFRGLRDTIVRSGPEALYRGYWFTLAASIPFLATSLSCHALLEKALLPPPGKHDTTLPNFDNPPRKLHPTQNPPGISYPPDERETQVAEAEQLRYFPTNLIIGVASGLLGQTVCYPLDTIRRRYQYDGACARGTGEPVYKSIREFVWKESIHERVSSDGVMRKVSAAQWLRSHYAGWGVLAMKTVPECALICGLYWLIKQKVA